MDPVLLVLTVIFLVAVTLAVLLPRGAARRQQVLATVSRESGLALNSTVEGAVLRRAERATKYVLVGGFIGWAAAAWAPTSAHAGFSGGLFILGTAVFGSALGNAAAALVDALARLQPDMPRLARATAVTVSDYVPSLERAASLIAVGVAVAAAALCAVLGVHSWVTLIGMPGVVVVSAAFAEVGSRYIAARPQHASTLVDLAWDDALRARNLRALFTAAPTATLYPVLAALFAIEDLGGPFTNAPIIGIAAAATVGTIGLIVHSRSHHSAARHFLTHLWPETASQLELAEQGAR